MHTYIITQKDRQGATYVCVRYGQASLMALVNAVIALNVTQLVSVITLLPEPV